MKGKLFKVYKLEGHKVIKVDDFIEWTEWYKTADRIVEKTYMEVASNEIKTGFIKQLEYVEVSTAFIGLDNSIFDSDNDPLVFETMVFGGEYDGYQEYKTSWRAAKKMHKAVVAMIKLSTTLWKPLGTEPPIYKTSAHKVDIEAIAAHK